MDLSNIQQQYVEKLDEEEFLDCFECYMDDVRGILVPTESKLTFIQNVVDDKNQKTSEIKYHMIKEIKWNAANQLFLTLIKSSKNKKIETIDDSVHLLLKIIQTELRNKPPADDYCYCKNHIIDYE